MEDTTPDKTLASSLDDIKRKYPFLAKPREVVIGTDFAFTGRTEEINEFAKEWTYSYIAFKQKKVYKKDWRLFNVYAASGVGKTRFGTDLLPLLLKRVETDPKSIEGILRFLDPKSELKEVTNLIRSGKWVYVDFSDGDMPDFTSITTDTILWLILLKLISPATLFSHNQTSEHNTKLLWDLIQYELKASPTTPVLLELHIDEFQKAISQSDLQTYLIDKSRVPFRQFCLQLMQVAMDAAQYGIFILPLFTGTLDVDYIGIFPGTDYLAVPILIQPENNEATRTTFLNHIPLQIRTQFEESIRLSQLLDTTGGVWRLYEALNIAIHDLREEAHNNLQQNISLLWKTFCLKVATRYSPTMATQAEELVAYTLAGIPVERNTMIGNIQVGSLMYSGYVILSKTKKNGVYRISLPFVLVVILYSELKLNFLLPPGMISKEETCPALSPQEFEKFVSCIQCIKMNVFCSLGRETVTMEEFHNGAVLSKEFASKKVLVKPMKYYLAIKEKFPDSLKKDEIKVQDCKTPVNIVNESVCVWVGRKCTMLDSFGTFIEPSDRKIFQGIENKYSDPGQLVENPIESSVVVTDELAKFQESVDIMGKRFEAYYFGFITNKLVGDRDNVSKKIDLFVDHINFIDYFGTTFKFLALSHIDTDKYSSRNRDDLLKEVKERGLKINKTAKLAEIVRALHTHDEATMKAELKALPGKQKNSDLELKQKKSTKATLQSKEEPNTTKKAKSAVDSSDEEKSVTTKREAARDLDSSDDENPKVKRQKKPRDDEPAKKTTRKIAKKY